MRSVYKSVSVFLGSILFLGCNEEVKQHWPDEFYLPKSECFTRYFYENTFTGNQEYELYCSDYSIMSLTKSKDSVCYDNGNGDVCVLIKDFETEFGQPEKLGKIDHHTLQFSLDTVVNWNAVEDSIDEIKYHQNQGITIALSVSTMDTLLYMKKFNCSRIRSFEPGLINVFQAMSNDSVYFINGEPDCLVLEMEYYDDKGDFGGWERFSTDIKALRVISPK